MLNTREPGQSLPDPNENLQSGFDLTGIGGIIGGIASAGTAYLNYKNQQKTNQINIQQAQMNRDFQANQAQIARDYDERMANTAYQRQMQDMQAAGLNPILAADKGSGAGGGGISSPSGAQTTVQAPQLEDKVGNIINNLNAIQQLKMTSAQIANVQAQNGNILADTILKGKQAGLTTQQASNLTANTGLTNEQTKTQAEITSQKKYENRPIVRTTGSGNINQMAGRFLDSQLPELKTSYKQTIWHKLGNLFN